MRKTPGRPRRRTRLARALGLDRNPLRRASDRAEAWIRIGLLVVFLTAGPIAALSVGGSAYHTGITAASEQAAQAVRVSATAPRPALGPGYRYWASQGWADTRQQSTGPSPRTNEMLAVIVTLTLTALALLGAQRLTLALFTRRRLAAWGAAWSRVGPQWSRGRP
jgi:hypothetical protein